MNKKHATPDDHDAFDAAAAARGCVPFGPCRCRIPGDLPDNERILQDTVRRDGPSRREFRIRRCDDGAVRHIESVDTVRANAQGETAWVVGTNLDVTERNTAEIQLRQTAADLSEADRRKDEFLATLAHELRNPLAPSATACN